jgi:hypothetical protein
MSTALSDLIPLRDTSAWAGYDSIAIIPRIYGRATVAPIRYSENGLTFVLADHALQGVDSVTLDGTELSGWRWRNGADLTGHAVALIDLSAAPDSGSVLAATVRGLSGNPADIINDLYPRSDLQDFRIWCSNAGLLLGGALDAKMTVRAALAFVLQQVGAVFSAGLPGFALPFPPPAGDPLHAEFGPLDLASWSAECSLSDLVTRLAVPFDWDYAAGKARQSVVLEATTASAAHGVRESELALPWVKTARQAVATATAWLQWRARPLWQFKFEAGVQFRSLQPGGWISITHPRLPVAGDVVVLDVDPGYGSGAVTITAQAPAGLEPAVTLVRQSAGFDA